MKVWILSNKSNCSRMQNMQSVRFACATPMCSLFLLAVSIDVAQIGIPTCKIDMSTIYSPHPYKIPPYTALIFALKSEISKKWSFFSCFFYNQTDDMPNVSGRGAVCNLMDSATDYNQSNSSAPSPSSELPELHNKLNNKDDLVRTIFFPENLKRIELWEKTL